MNPNVSFPIKCPKCRYEFVVPHDALRDHILGVGTDTFIFEQRCPKCQAKVGDWKAVQPCDRATELTLYFRSIRHPDKWIVTIFTHRCG